MATPQNRILTTVDPKNPQKNTSKKTYTTSRYGNDHGSITFGHIHKPGDVRSDVMIQGSDGRHHFTLDKDGDRKGSTIMGAPGRFALRCGDDKEEAEDTCWINAVNGNIHIVATNGKIIFQATDIEMKAVGEGGRKGNIRLKATESIELDGKKVLINAKSLYKLATAGSAEIVANNCMKIYSSMIRGVTDAVATRDSKVGGKDFQSKQQ
jgi:hypothetical protein